MKILLTVFFVVLPLFFPQAQDLANEQARAYREEGYRLQSMGDISGALSYYQKAVQIDPHYAEAYNDLGVAYETLGNNEEALRMYKKSLDLDPEHLATYTNLAFLYEKRGDIENATLYWKKRYLAGERGDYWWEVARQHLLKLGTYPEVKKAVFEEKAARLSRELIYKREQQRLKLFEEAKLHFDLGNNALKVKDYEIAFKEFKTVLSLNIDDEKLNMQTRDLIKQAERLYLKKEAYINAKNALDYIEKDDYLSAGDKLRNALTAVFRISQKE